ncbi:MAG: hypothetical protein U0X20_07220 [Caldilineaceae bacterium]
MWTDSEQNRRAWEWGAGDDLFGEDPDWMADRRCVHASSATGETDLLRLMNGATNQRTIFNTPSIGSIAAAPDSGEIRLHG